MYFFSKSFVANFIACLLIFIGWSLDDYHVKSVGFYALSGALTNWMAIYMLFEKIPFLYGSGVIPNKFENFKEAIKKMIMEQFFSHANLHKFLNGEDIKKHFKNILIDKIDYNKIFDSFIDMLMNSKYGSMIEMFLGNREALENLREPFISKINSKITKLITEIDMDHQDISAQLRENIERIIDARINELTPQMVKEIIQKIIREHLGWLVIWGGAFGGLIGLIVSFVG